MWCVILSHLLVGKMSIVLEPLIYGTLGNRRYISAKCKANNVRLKIIELKNLKYVYLKGFIRTN